MRVVEVIPIVKGITKSTLSYFTKDKYAVGSFVKVPVRSGTALAIVSSSIEARASKFELKTASFALKKLSKVEKFGKLSSALMQAVEETARFYATTAGNILSAVISKTFLENLELLTFSGKEKVRPVKEVRLIQLVDVERFREYRGIVREGFARNTSTLFIVPTNEDVRRAKDLLSQGIERYVYTIDDIRKAREEKHPILFITTFSLSAFERKDLDIFILERENSRAYRTLSRPFINLKVFLEFYTKARGATLILGDAVLSIESLWREKCGEYTEFSPLTWRLKYENETEVVDMLKEKDFKIFSRRLEQVLTKSWESQKKIFVFSARKGFAPSTVCEDCGSLLLCRNCRSPLVLHKNIYLCHHCGAKRSTETKCDYCESWRLKPLGLGSERIADECQKLFPEARVLVLDKDHIKTSAKARLIVKKFLESEQTILVGTELALNYLPRVPLVVAPSLDSLLSLPDFGVGERIFYLITKLRELALERLLIQTRNAKTDILTLASTGNVLDFFRNEIKEREEIMYPPFSIFIKVSTKNNKATLEKKSTYLQSLFKDFSPHFILENRGESRVQTLSMIIRLKRSDWPHEGLGEKLLLLSSEFLIKVDAESIL